MGILRYYLRVVQVAFTHTLHSAHTIILLLILAAGVATYFLPRIEIMVDLHGVQIFAVVAALIFAVRLLLAPYWIWRESQAEIRRLTDQLEALESERSDMDLVFADDQYHPDLGNRSRAVANQADVQHQG
jgi:hypothetical protein